MYSNLRNIIRKIQLYLHFVINSIGHKKLQVVISERDFKFCNRKKLKLNATRYFKCGILSPLFISFVRERGISVKIPV